MSQKNNYPYIFWKSPTETIVSIGDGFPNAYCFHVEDFFQNRKSDIWKSFPNKLHIHPKKLWIDEKQILGKPENLPKLEKRIFKNSLININFSPNKPEWIDLIKKAKKAPFGKCVLARDCTFSFEEKVDPLQVFSSLPKHSSYAFFVWLDDHKAFMGISPERLFRREGHLIYTEALAGTRKRGINEQEDARFEKELLQSEKDLHEFSYVSKFLEDKLKNFSLDIKKSSQKVKKTHSVQHLHQEFSAKLSNIDDQALLNILHPTPALGGSNALALDWIKKNEPIDRGWYGAPIGWITDKFSDFAVGIRSCLVDDNKIHVFTGLGVVKDSNPELEWQELNDKMKHFSFLYETNS